MKKIIVVALILAGCATSGHRIDQSNLLEIREGVTTKIEVIELLGKPEMINLTSDGKEVMMYYHMDYKTRPSTFIPFAGLLLGGADMKQQITQILINKDGVVEKYIFTDSQTPINSGLLNQK